MKLYVAHISAYARLTRIMVIEKELQHQVCLNFRETRIENNPLYEIQPSGRVPTLVTKEGNVYEDSALICAYLDAIDGAPRFARPDGPPGWIMWQREAQARSLVDGLSVWIREMRRPEHERSATTIEHERTRALRMADAFAQDIDHQIWQSDFNMAQMLLITALQIEARLPEFAWRHGREALARWADRAASRPSIAQTSALE